MNKIIPFLKIFTKINGVVRLKKGAENREGYIFSYGQLSTPIIFLAFNKSISDNNIAALPKMNQFD